MSSGLGKHQKAILAILETSPDTLVSDLARELHGGMFTSQQYNNLTAALESLERRGLVELYTAWVPDPWRHNRSGALPAVRLTSVEPRRWPTVDEISTKESA